MTTTPVFIVRHPRSYRRVSDRLAVSIARALVRWAEGHVTRPVVPHERRVRILENDRALADRATASARMAALRG